MIHIAIYIGMVDVVSLLQKIQDVKHCVLPSQSSSILRDAAAQKGSALARPHLLVRVANPVKKGYAFKESKPLPRCLKDEQVHTDTVIRLVIASVVSLPQAG